MGDVRSKSSSRCVVSHCQSKPAEFNDGGDAPRASDIAWSSWHGCSARMFVECGTT